MEKKYELTDEVQVMRFSSRSAVLHRIRALKDFRGVKKGDLGGWVESEDNLSHEGNCWIYDNSIVMAGAVVSEDARLAYEAVVDLYSTIRGQATLSQNARVTNHSSVDDRAFVGGSARIDQNSRIYENAMIYGDVIVNGSEICCNARVDGSVRVEGGSKISGCSNVIGLANFKDHAVIMSERDYFVVGPIGSRGKYTTFYKTKRGIYVSCGCFTGSIDEFERKVKITHGGKHERYERNHEADYLRAIAFAKEMILGGN